MTKEEFISMAHLELKEKANILKAKYRPKINGNAFNKVVKDINKKSKDSGLFWTGEYSSTNVEKDGSKAKIQNHPNWFEIFKKYCE